MAPTNHAALFPAKSTYPLHITPVPYTSPDANEIVIKNAALAINPVDWAVQLLGTLIFPHLKYPFIPGVDVAGQVVEVGKGVRKFNVGDRVFGLAMGGDPDSRGTKEGGFQTYTMLRDFLAVKIPEGVRYEEACVLPLALATAAYGLFHEQFLGLHPPSVPPPAITKDTQAVIITGASSSVGCNAIQLAVAAGYEVYTTASPKNFEHARRLGAAGVFDYHSNTLVDDLSAALKGKKIAGAYAIGDGAAEACTTVLRRSPGSKKFIALAGTSMHPEKLTSSLGTATVLISLMFWFFKTAVVSLITGVKVKFIDMKGLKEPDGVVARLVYENFIQEALERKQFVCAPEPVVVGSGLEKVQEAMDEQKKGVSAKKIVVTL